MVDLIKLQKEAYDSLNKRNFERTLEILTELKSIEKKDFNICQLIASLLVDLGGDTKNLEYVEEGIVYFEKLSKSNLGNIYYNLANAYSAKIDIVGESNVNLDNITLFDVKKYYKKALENGYNTLECSTNLANTYIKMGRFVEAIEIYEDVLKKEPNHSMTLLNKGITLYEYNSLTTFKTPLLIDAYDCFQKVLKIPDTSLKEEILSKQYIDIIEKLTISDKLKKDYENELITSKSNDFESFLTNFCVNHKLYLNLCNFCQRCDNSVGDSIVIKNMTTKITSNLEDDSYLILSSFLNQIKMDFISARFLIALSQYEDIRLDFIDKSSFIVDTFQYEDNTFKTQLLKSAFKNFFDILDKIAIFINKYLELGIKPSKVNFKNVWFYKGDKFNGLNYTIKNSQNKGISALFDIYRSFEENEEYHYLRIMRNHLTHKFLNITYFKISDDDKTPEDLLDDTLLLAKIVKNSIIYLINLVSQKEEQKSIDLEDENVLVMFSKFVE